MRSPAKKLISHLSHLHATDDPVLSAQKILTELYEMQEVVNNRTVRRAIKILSRYVHKKVN